MSENYRLSFRVSAAIRWLSGIKYVLSRYHGMADAWCFLRRDGQMVPLGPSAPLWHPHSSMFTGEGHQQNTGDFSRTMLTKSREMGLPRCPGIVGISVRGSPWMWWSFYGSLPQSGSAKGRPSSASISLSFSREDVMKCTTCSNFYKLKEKFFWFFKACKSNSNSKMMP